MIPDGPAPQLPQPDPERRSRGEASSFDASHGRGPAFERVRARLRSEGRLTFAVFMAEALYGPDGYYTRRPRLGGATADFFTSPELHPAFGALFGRLAAGVWEHLGRPARFDIVEHGPGTGALCRDLLTWADHVWPAFGRAIQYQLIESSPALQAAQRATLAAARISSGRVVWVEAPSPQPPPPCAGEGEAACSCSPLSAPTSEDIVVSHSSPLSAPERGVGGVRSPRQADSVKSTGLILANELVDALPVHLVAMRDGALRERYVVLDQDDGLGWLEDAPSTSALAAYFERLGVWPGNDCIAEVNLEGVAWAERTATTLERGALLLLDYGYPAPELYAPTRRFGTLLTYHEHTLGSDPLTYVGGQDITAHVDFTSLARAGERGGLETVGLISQAALLGRLGLDRYLRQLERGTVSAGAYDANRRALQALIEPGGLGNVQALLQTRGMPGFDPFAVAGGAPDHEAAQDWLPLLHPDQMRLPGPLEAEGFVDLDAQWRELIGETDDAGDADSKSGSPEG